MTAPAPTPNPLFNLPAGSTAKIGDEPGTLRELHIAQESAAAAHMTIPGLIRLRAERSPNQVMIERKQGLGGNWRPVTAGEFIDEMDAVARGLIGMGLRLGDRLAILAPTSYEWTLLDYAALSIGVVVVPIYETDSASQIRAIMDETRFRMALTHSRQSADLIGAIARELGHECKVMAFSTGAIVDIIEAGRDIAWAALEARAGQVTMDSLATIVYTSGTTGQPKGVCLTHGNGVHTILDGIGNTALFKPGNLRVLFFLPVAHVYARVCQWYAMTQDKCVVAQVPDTRNLLGDIQKFCPTLLLVVPRVMEKIYNAAEAKAGKGVRLRLFRAAAKTAIAYSRALDTPEGPNSTLKASHAFYQAAILHKIPELLGGKCDYVVSGGGPLGKRLGHFFRGVGLQVLEGYGLTETLGPIAVNTLAESKIGSVGRPLPGASVRLGDNNELQFKGPMIFQGYYNNEAETRATFTPDGWFVSGDSGWIDADGFIHISGRLKELIVTAGGKNVVPETLEDALRGHPLISQVVVVGDRRPFISALLTLDREMLPLWLANHKLPQMDVSDAARHPEVLSALDRAVERANSKVSRAESIRKIRVLTTTFTEENGMLTPSLKVRRKQVMRVMKREIDQIYGGPVQMDDEDDDG